MFHWWISGTNKSIKLNTNNIVHNKVTISSSIKKTINTTS
uniref:Uncharacterized protein n=1 Tax=Medicago truncatula TaxID=3880 RepID=I3T5C2_MEDTR|nr:unknown [Medicago truncatula]